MKKKALIFVAAIALLAVTMTLFSACDKNNNVDQNLESMTAAEALTSVSKWVWDDDVVGASDWERTDNVVPSIYDTGSETEAYHALAFHFNKDKYGLEFGALQFDIVSDCDVEGYWWLHFYVEGGGFDVNTRVNYTLTANEKQTITIDFDNNFSFLHNVDYAQLDISFKTDLNEGGPSWQRWAKTKYTISNWKIKINH